MKYLISTNATMTEVEAPNEDQAARKFAVSEPIYSGYEIDGVADLVEAAEAMGGWATVKGIGALDYP